MHCISAPTSPSSPQQYGHLDIEALLVETPERSNLIQVQGPGVEANFRTSRQVFCFNGAVVGSLVASKSTAVDGNEHGS